jgi:hypothetical protein
MFQGRELGTRGYSGETSERSTSRLPVGVRDKSGFPESTWRVRNAIVLHFSLRPSRRGRTMCVSGRVGTALTQKR